MNKFWGASKGGKATISKTSKNALNKKMKFVRKFKHIKIVKIRQNRTFCEFYGAIMGDGCLSEYMVREGYKKYVIILTTDRKRDWDYIRYLKSLVEKEFGIDAYIRDDIKHNVTRLEIRNKSLFDGMKRIGFPIGEKGRNLKIPNKLLILPWKVKKFIVRGLFDTDGSIFGKKNEGYKYPYICITSISSVLLNQLYLILRKQGYPCYISSDDLLIKGIKNTKKWMSDIGTSNPKHKFKYDYWLKNAILPKGLV